MNTIETSETCLAGVGTLLLEFATLSRLTGDKRFEVRAFKILAYAYLNLLKFQV